MTKGRRRAMERERAKERKGEQGGVRERDAAERDSSLPSRWINYRDQITKERKWEH